MATKASAERMRDADASRANILAVACEVFAEEGFTGARVDAIAERTRTSKRMIYYHFGSKEGLYLAVLERAYTDIRSFENERVTADLSPRKALSRMIELTFDYDEAHPEFVRLVAIENIHNARHMRDSSTLRTLNLSVVAVLRDILERGVRDGTFRAGIDPMDVHMLISAFCFFRVANRHTFDAVFGRDMLALEGRDQQRALIVEAVLRYLAPDAEPSPARR